MTDDLRARWAQEQDEPILSNWITPSGDVIEVALCLDGTLWVTHNGADCVEQEQ